MCVYVGSVLATSSLVCRSENLGDEDPEWSGVVASSPLPSSISRFEASQEGITIVDYCWDGGSFLSAKGLTRSDWLIGREDNRKELVDASRRPRVPGGGCPPVRTGEYTFTRLETTRGEEADKCSSRVAPFLAFLRASFPLVRSRTRQMWSQYYNSAFFPPMFLLDFHPWFSEWNLFETIVLRWMYKQKDEISWRNKEGGEGETVKRKSKEIRKVGRKTDSEVGIQRCTVCSLAFNFSTSQWTAPRLVRPGREQRTDFSSRPQILVQVRDISEFAAVDALESSLGGVEWHVHDTVRTRGTVDSSNRASNRASNSLWPPTAS